MSQSNSGGGVASPVIMLLSAAIFAYFGFFMGMTATAADGQFVLFFALLLWTLRISAVVFAAAALITFVLPRIGSLIYAVGGLLSAAGFVVVGVWDMIDQTYAAAISPFLAFLFAAWNGYGAWTGLREAMAGGRDNGAGSRGNAPG